MAAHRKVKMQALPPGPFPNCRSAGLLLLVLVTSAGACGDVNVDDPFRRASAVADSARVARVVVAESTCPRDLLGSATVMRSTTGGGTVAPVTVTTLAGLMAYAGRAEPTIVRVRGMISVAPESQPSFQIPVGSNKTIIGADAQSGLTGGGFLINDAQNVIIQNLVIALPVSTDGIAVRASKHVWIDHCELYGDTKHSTNYYGWLVDVMRPSNFITVSWNWFHDHFNTVQVEGSDRNGPEDTDPSTVTIHHNFFQGTVSGEPLVRFGTVHVFNNHYQNIRGYAIASLMYSQVAVEENVFEDVAIPLTNEPESSARSFAGQIEDLGNSCYPSCTNAIVNQTGKAFTFMPSDSYPYLADSTSSVPVIVGACAGPSAIQKSKSAQPSDRIAPGNAVLLSGRLQP